MPAAAERAPQRPGGLPACGPAPGRRLMRACCGRSHHALTSRRRPCTAAAAVVAAAAAKYGQYESAHASAGVSSSPARRGTYIHGTKTQQRNQFFSKCLTFARFSRPCALESQDERRGLLLQAHEQCPCLLSKRGAVKEQGARRVCGSHCWRNQAASCGASLSDACDNRQAAQAWFPRSQVVHLAPLRTLRRRRVVSSCFQMRQALHCNL